MAYNPFAFDDLSNLVLDKQKTVGEVAADKAKILPLIADERSIEYLPDADTVWSDGQEFRFDDGLDTFESYIPDDADINDPKFKHQAEAAAKVFNMPVEEVTLTHIQSLGVDAKNKARSLYGNGGAEGTKFYTIESGEKGKYGRSLARVYNEQGFDIGEELSGKQYNAAYDAPWNKDKRIADFKREQEERKQQLKSAGFKSSNETSGFNAETGKPEIVPDTDGTFSYGEYRGLTKGTLEALEPIVEGQYASRHSWSNKNGLINAAARFVTAVGSFVDMGHVAALGHNRNIDEAVDEYNVGLAEQPNLFGRYAITSDELSAYKEIAGKDKGDLTAEQAAFMETDHAADIKKLDDTLAENQKKISDIRKQAEKDAGRVFTTTDKIVEARIAKAYKDKGVGAALLESAKNFGNLSSQAMASIPHTLALMSPVTALPAMTAMFEEGQYDNYNEFVKINEREPSDEEKYILDISTMAGVLAEKIGTDLLTRGVPGLGKAITNMVGKAGKPVRFLGARLPGAFGEEFLQEGATALANEYAVKQDLGKVDDWTVFKDAVYGGAAGVGMTSSFAAGGKLMPGSKTRTQLADIEEKLGRATDRIFKLDKKIKTETVNNPDSDKLEKLERRFEKEKSNLVKFSAGGVSPSADKQISEMYEQGELVGKNDTEKKNIELAVLREYARKEKATILDNVELTKEAQDGLFGELKSDVAVKFESIHEKYKGADPEVTTGPEAEAGADTGTNTELKPSKSATEAFAKDDPAEHVAYTDNAINDFLAEGGQTEQNLNRVLNAGAYHSKQGMKNKDLQDLLATKGKEVAEAVQKMSQDAQEAADEVSAPDGATGSYGGVKPYQTTVDEGTVSVLSQSVAKAHNKVVELVSKLNDSEIAKVTRDVFRGGTGFTGLDEYIGLAQKGKLTGKSKQELDTFVTGKEARAVALQNALDEFNADPSPNPRTRFVSGKGGVYTVTAEKPKGDYTWVNNSSNPAVNTARIEADIAAATKVKIDAVQDTLANVDRVNDLAKQARVVTKHARPEAAKPKVKTESKQETVDAEDQAMPEDIESAGSGKKNGWKKVLGVPLPPEVISKMNNGRLNAEAYKAIFKFVGKKKVTYRYTEGLSKAGDYKEDTVDGFVYINKLNGEKVVIGKRTKGDYAGRYFVEGNNDLSDTNHSNLMIELAQISFENEVVKLEEEKENKTTESVNAEEKQQTRPEETIAEEKREAGAETKAEPKIETKKEDQDGLQGKEEKGKTEEIIYQVAGNNVPYKTKKSASSAIGRRKGLSHKTHIAIKTNGGFAIRKRTDSDPEYTVGSKSKGSRRTAELKDYADIAGLSVENLLIAFSNMIEALQTGEAGKKTFNENKAGELKVTGEKSTNPSWFKKKNENGRPGILYGQSKKRILKVLRLAVNNEPMLESQLDILYQIADAAKEEHDNDPYKDSTEQMEKVELEFSSDPEYGTERVVQLKDLSVGNKIAVEGMFEIQSIELLSIEDGYYNFSSTLPGFDIGSESANDSVKVIGVIKGKQAENVATETNNAESDLAPPPMDEPGYIPDIEEESGSIIEDFGDIDVGELNNEPEGAKKEDIPYVIIGKPKIKTATERTTGKLVDGNGDGTIHVIDNELAYQTAFDASGIVDSDTVTDGASYKEYLIGIEQAKYKVRKKTGETAESYNSRVEAVAMKVIENSKAGGWIGRLKDRFALIKVPDNVKTFLKGNIRLGNIFKQKRLDTVSLVNLLGADEFAQGFSGKDIIRVAADLVQKSGDKGRIREIASLFDDFKEAGIFYLDSDKGRAWAKYTGSNFLAKYDSEKEGVSSEYRMSDQVMLAAAISFADWVATSGSRTTNPDPRTISMALYGDEYDGDITSADIAFVEEFGLPLYTLARSLGNNMLKVMGIDPNLDAGDTGIEKAKLDSSVFSEILDRDSWGTVLGSMIFELSGSIKDQDGGLIKFTLHDKVNLGKNSGATVHGKSLKTIKLNDNKSLLFKLFGSKADELMKALAGVSLDRSGIYIGEPKDSVQKSVRGSKSKLPANRRKVLEKKQNEKWHPVRSNIAQFLALTNGMQRKMMGWVDPKKVHIDHRDSQTAKNNDIDSQIAALVKLNEDGVDEFYLGYYMSNQYRLLIDSAGINPLNSKALHRFMVNVEGVASTFTRATGDKVNRRKLIRYKYSIVQALGGDFDKINHMEVLKAFDAIANDPDILIGVELLGSAEFEAWVDLRIKSDEKFGAHQLAGLIALKGWVNDDAEITTHLGIEVDGITNGFALGLIQFPVSPEDKGGFTWEMLQKVGILHPSLNRSKTGAGFEGIRGTIVDAYLTAGNEFIKQLLMNNYLGGKFYSIARITDDNGDKKWLRDLMKQPFMIANYSGGPAKYTEGIAIWMADKVYENIAEMKLHASEKADLERYLRNTLSGIFDDAKIDEILNAEKFNEVSIENEISAFKGFIIEEYKDLVEKAFKLLTDPTSEQKNDVSDLMNGVANLFIKKYNLDVELATSNLKGSRSKLNRFEKDKIIEELIDTFYPKMRGMWADLDDDGKVSFMDMLEFKKINSEENAVNYIKRHKNIGEFLIEVLRSTRKEKAKYFLDTVFGSGQYSESYIPRLEERFNSLSGKNRIAQTAILMAKMQSDSDTVIGLDNDTLVTVGSKSPLPADKMGTPGAKTLVRSIQNYDSAIIAKTIAESVTAFLTLHDAVYSGIGEIDSIVEAMNRNMGELSQKYNILNEAIEQANNSIESAKKFLPTLKSKRGKANETIDAFRVYNRKNPKVLKALNEYDMARNALHSTYENKKDQNSMLKGVRKVLNNLLAKAEKLQYYMPGTVKGGNKLFSLGKKRDEKVTPTDQAADELGSELYGTLLEEDLSTINSKLKAQDKLNRHGEDSQHSVYLDGLLENFIAPAMRKVDGIMLSLRETTDIANGWFDMASNSIEVRWSNKLARTLTEMSGQEVYAHELTHAVVARAIAKSPRFTEKVRRMKDAVKRDLGKDGWKVFLADPRLEDNPEDVEMAKEQYNAIFNDPSLQEFVAYGLTNASLVSKLTGMKPRKQFDWFIGDNWYEKVLNVLVTAIELVTNVTTGKGKPENMYQDLLGLVQDAVGINNSKVAGLARAVDNISFEKSDKLIIAGAKKVFEKTSPILLRAAAKTAHLSGSTADTMRKTNNRLAKIAATPAGLLGAFSFAIYLPLAAMHSDPTKNTYDERVEALKLYTDAIGKLRSQLEFGTLQPFADVVFDTTRQMFKRTAYDIARLLNRSKYEIEHMRVRDKEEMRKWMKSAFNIDVTEAESIMMTEVFGATDLQALVQLRMIGEIEVSIGEIRRLIREPDRLNNLIQLHRERLGATNGGYWDNQVQGLAEKMLSGETNRKLVFKNVLAMNKNATAAVKKTEEQLADIDKLISLVALSRTRSTSREAVSSLWARDIAKGGHGVEFAVEMLQSVNMRAAEDAFAGQKIFMQKGYIPKIHDPHKDVQVTFVDSATKEQMKKKGYTFQYNVDQRYQGNDPVGLYAADKIPVRTRIKGLFSVTSKKRAHTSVSQSMIDRFLVKHSKLIEKRDAEKYNSDEYNKINDKIKKLNKEWDYRAQRIVKDLVKEESAGVNSGSPALSPVVDLDGKIIDFTYDMSLKHERKFLSLNENIFDVVPEANGRVTDKANSEKINNEGVDLLLKRAAEHRLGNEHEFVNLLDTTINNESFARLPESIRRRIVSIAKENGGNFWVEIGYMDTLFGYDNWGISELIKGEAGKLMARKFEEMVHGIVGTVNNNIVIKTSDVWGANFLSNFITSVFSGINPVQTVRYWREALYELNRLQADGIKLRKEEALIRIGKGNKKKAAYLKGRINANPTIELVDAGLYTAITTEGMFADEFSYKNKLVKMVEGKVGEFTGGGTLSKIVKAAYIAEDTSAYNSLLSMVQVSDFVGRYGIYKHMTEVQGKSKKEAYNYIQDVFIDYNVPVGKLTEWANSMGMIMFYKYWLRIQRPALAMIKHHPTKAIIALGLRSYTGFSPDSIWNSSIILGGNFAPSSAVLNPIDTAKQLLIPSGIESIPTGIAFGVNLAEITPFKGVIDKFRKKDDADGDPQYQRKSNFIGINEVGNKLLFSKIKNRLQEQYPEIDFSIVDSLADKNGASVLGRAFRGAVEVSSDAAMDTMPHEYAHIYLDLLETTTFVDATIRQVMRKKNVSRREAKELLAKAMGESYAKEMSAKLGFDVISSRSIVGKIWDVIIEFFYGSDKNLILSRKIDELNKRFFSGDSADAIRFKPKKGYSKVNIESTLKNNEFAGKIVSYFSDVMDGVSLTGSVALAAQGNVYRAGVDSMHDLDFVLQNKDLPEAQNNLLDRYPDSIEIADFFTDEGGRVATYIVPQPGTKVANLKRYKDYYQGRVISYDLVSKRTGKRVGTYEANVSPVEGKKYKTNLESESTRGVKAVLVDLLANPDSPPVIDYSSKELGREIKIAEAGYIFKAKNNMTKMNPPRDKDVMDFLFFNPNQKLGRTSPNEFARR